MARVPLLPVLATSLGLLAVDLLIIGLGIDDKTIMVVAIIASGLVLGVANAMLSNLLLGLSTQDTSIAASATNFVRFAGGAVAPFLAGKLSEHVSAAAPLYVGAGAVAVGLALVVAGRRVLTPPARATAVASIVEDARTQGVAVEAA
jgi:predicted MFS family arabinose efflux permease